MEDHIKNIMNKHVENAIKKCNIQLEDHMIYRLKTDIFSHTHQYFNEKSQKIWDCDWKCNNYLSCDKIYTIISSSQQRTFREIISRTILHALNELNSKYKKS